MDKRNKTAFTEQQMQQKKLTGGQAAKLKYLQRMIDGKRLY